MATDYEQSSKVTRSRERMRVAGLRPVQVWVPDTRLASFAADLRQQCLALEVMQRDGGSVVTRQVRYPD